VSNLSSMHRMRMLMGVLLAAATLAVLISRGLREPDLQTAVASALAAEHRLIAVALEQYPKQGPAIIVTYGGLDLFREQLARFGPQVVPIVAAYQQSFTTADVQQRARAAIQVLEDFLANLPQLAEDALQALRQATNDFLESWSTRVWPFVEPGADAPEITGEAPDPDEGQTAAENDGVELDGVSKKDRGLIAPLRDWLPSWFTPAQRPAAPAADAPGITGEAPDPDEEQAAAENDAVELGRLSPEQRGLIALLNMREQGNAFVGQWEITAAGEAKWVPSRVVVLGGTELLIPGLTDLERRIVQEREVDWQTYGLAAVDLAVIASGATLLRFAKTAGRGMHAVRDAAKIPRLRSGGLAVAKVLGINAVRFGLPTGLAVLMVLHPGVFTQYLWLLAESLDIPGIIGPLIGWAIVIVPLSFFLSWMLLSVRLLRFAGWLLTAAARGCRQLGVRLAVPDRR
jgi:hypothetical protein